jgi:hypothetical protein
MKTTEERISEIHADIKALFPDATSVNVFVNSEGIDVQPTYKTELSGYSMRNISGKWVKGAVK